MLGRVLLPGRLPGAPFSLRHRRNMKRLFASRYSVPTTEIKPKLCRRTVAIIVAAIFLALVAVSGAAYFIGSFIMKEQNDNTQLMAASISEAPETIKQTYTLDGLPDGYREIDSYSDDFESVIIYQFEDDLIVRLHLLSWLRMYMMGVLTQKAMILSRFRLMTMMVY